MHSTALGIESHATGPLWGRQSVAVAWSVLALAVVHPPHGLSIPICWLRASCGIPCPGCGITRSLSCVMRGLFSEAWSYNPFGIAFAIIFAAIAAVSVSPTFLRQRLQIRMRRVSTLTNAIYLILVASFAGYGLLRGLFHVLAR